MGMIRWLLVPAVVSVGLLWVAAQPAEAARWSVHVSPHQVRYYSPHHYTPHVYRPYAVPRYYPYPSYSAYRPRVPVGVHVYAGPVGVHVYGGGLRTAYPRYYRTPVYGPRPIVRYHVW